MSPLFRATYWSLDSLTPPWGSLSAIFEHVRLSSSESLPDEPLIREKSKFGWIAGAWDGVLGHHWRGSDPPARAFEIASALQKVLQRADPKTLTALYRVIIDEPILPSLELLNEELSELLPVIDRNRLLQLGKYLLLYSAHREAVKFGIVLVGFAGSSADVDILQVIGGNEEFTLYAATALGRVASDPERELWNLAKRVSNWGRIQIVQLLSDTKNADIQAWMLRDGFRNGVMVEYLACICARTGRLHEALQQQPVDNAVLDGAADIIHAMIMGGPAGNIDDYAQAGEACAAYLNCVLTRHELGLRHFLAVDRLNWFLSEPDGWNERLKSGWTQEKRDRLAETCDDILRWETWREQTLLALQSDNYQVFYEGDTAAQVLSIDTWQLHFDRVKATPVGSSYWYRLMQQTNESRIDAVLNFAESALPFSEIETGPADEMGLGYAFQAHQALDWVLQDLRRFPGKGWKLIKAGLQSPVVRNRNMAINAIAAWHRNLWSADIITFLLNAHEIEPRKDVKVRIGRLIEGKPVS
jgi:hypothetical protein